MKLKSMLVGMAMALAAVLPAQAQRGPGGPPGTWELLGEERVGYGSDRDEMEIRQNEQWFREKSFRTLRFVAQGGDIKIRRIILVYMNGHQEELDFKGDMRAGQQVDVPLRGERSYIQKIGFDYASKISFSFGSGGIRIGQATMRVYGENVRQVRPVAPPPPPPLPPPSAGGWNTIGDVVADRRDDRVVIQVGRNEGRIGQIRLRVDGQDGVVVKELRVQFANRDTQTIPVAQRLEPGYSTDRLDLDGETRRIERVVVILDPRNRPGRVNYTLQGTERAGRDNDATRPGAVGPARGNWERLGSTTVGFGVDRDVIRVDQNEAWFKDRGFDKLHFTAQNNEIYMQSIRVTYRNGVTEDYRVDRLIPAGGDLAVDLPGARSYIREIGMVYRARPGFRGNSILTVFGEKAGRR